MHMAGDIIMKGDYCEDLGHDSDSGIITELGQLPTGAILDEAALGRMFNRCSTSVKRAIERGELPPPVRLFGKPCWTAGCLLNHIEKRLETARECTEKEARRIERLSL